MEEKDFHFYASPRFALAALKNISLCASLLLQVRKKAVMSIHLYLNPINLSFRRFQIYGSSKTLLTEFLMKLICLKLEKTSLLRLKAISLFQPNCNHTSRTAFY